MATLTEKTRANLPLTALWSLGVGLVIVTAAIVVKAQDIDKATEAATKAAEVSAQTAQNVAELQKAQAVQAEINKSQSEDISEIKEAVKDQADEQRRMLGLILEELRRR